jgi:XTP/dITP diphosphohydrolase
MKIVIASSNQGKLKEIQAYLSDVNLSFVPQSTLGIPDAEETGLSFVENALIKARQAARLSGLPALADDSGIVVPYLNGQPGIYSARYAGVHSDFSANITKLIQALHDASPLQRRAYFYCCLVFLKHENDPCPIIAEGRWQGEVTLTPTGVKGFGYDPIFYVPELNKTAAELSIEEKNQFSHRAIALKQFHAQWIKTYL